MRNKNLKQFVLNTHRWLGLAMSILFVMWFMSGIVMIYHTFPKPQTNLYFANQNFLSKSDLLCNLLPSDTNYANTPITLEKPHGEAVFRYGAKTSKPYSAANLKPIKEFGPDDCITILEANFSAAIKKQETVNDFDQWIPWAYYEAYFPIEKFYLKDAEATEVYISRQTGDIVQHTNRLSRCMAYIGAIPHWLYLKQLRLKAALWSEVIIILSVIGCFVCLSGIVVGFIRIKQKNKKHAFDLIPYKKQGLKWHHITGLAFGLFVFTFILSGLMSLAAVPTWLVKKESSVNYRELWNRSDETTRSNGFKAILHSLPDSSVRKITRLPIMGRYVYKVYYNSEQHDTMFCSDAVRVQALNGTNCTDIENYLRKILPDKNFKIDTLTTYTNVYQKGRGHINPLPVYRINLNDTYKTHLYVSAQSGELLQVDSTYARSAWWLYQGLHTFNFSWFSKIEWLRQAWLIFISIGGLALSITGVYIGFKRYLR